MENILLDSPVKTPVNRIDLSASRVSQQSERMSFKGQSDARPLKRISKFEPLVRLNLDTFKNIISPDVIDIAVGNLDSPLETISPIKLAGSFPANLKKQSLPFLKSRNKKSASGYRGRKVFSNNKKVDKQDSEDSTIIENNRL